MKRFCTGCGTPATAEGLFCENCGAALKPVVPPAERAPEGRTPVPPVAEVAVVTTVSQLTGKRLWWAVAASAVVVGGIGAVLLAYLHPPNPTSERLLAAVQSASFTAQANKNLAPKLCISNMDYSASPFHVSAMNARAQAWLDGLAAAGLYSAGERVTSGGYFPQELIRYEARPELEKWRQGKFLCVAKGVRATEVVDVSKPEDITLAEAGKRQASSVARGRINWVASDPAPWLKNIPDRQRFDAELHEWSVKGDQLSKSTSQFFVLIDNTWTTATDEQLHSARKSNNRSADAEKPSVVGISAWLAKLPNRAKALFSFGHPLTGRWQLDTKGMLGKSVSELGLAGNELVVFTSDTMESNAHIVKCTFAVEGDRVVVTPLGEEAGMVFTLSEDRQRATMDVGFFTITYHRIQ